MTTETGFTPPEAQEAHLPFPFFVGCGRSGTSLLRAIFDSHPGMSVPDDTYFILNLATHRGRYERSTGFDVDAFLTDLSRQFDFENWAVGIKDIEDEARSLPPRSYPDAVRQIFRLCARRQGKTRYGNKSPVHVRGLSMLARLFPEARFVHIIRDGRNVALSYLSADFGPTTLESAALRWRRHVARGRKTGKHLGPARYREVRYEQLLDHPEETIRSLCDFLGLEYDERMLKYYERTQDLYAGNQPPAHHRNLALPPTKGLRDWRNKMGPAEVARFESIGGSLLDELGYERGTAHPGIGVRFGTWRSLLPELIGRVPKGVLRRIRARGI